MTSNLRKLLLELSIPLLLIAAIDVGFARWVDNNPTAPLPKLFNMSIATGKYLAFLRTLRSGEQVDIIYTGMSPMMSLDAAAIDAALARGGRPARGFNFAGPAEGSYFSLPLLERIVEPLTAPTLVVHGLMPLDVILEPRSETDAIAQLLELPVFSIHRDGFRVRFEEVLLTRIALIQYREAIVDWLSGRAEPDASADVWNVLARDTDAWGKIRFQQQHQPQPEVESLRPYEKQYQEDLHGFRRSMKETLVFARTIGFALWCQRQGIDFVLVNTPVHPLFIEMLPRGRADYALFVDELHRTAKIAGISLFDPLGPEPAPREFFTDTHHHNLAGAKWFSERLAEHLLAEGLPNQRR